MNNRYTVFALVAISMIATISAASGYTFQTYIGSVLNGGITSNSLISTKSLQTSYPYALPETLNITNEASPYSAASYVPYISTPVAAFNGGGVSFSSFTSSNYDNIVKLNTSQAASLAQNVGIYHEYEYMYLTGFPVYDQQANNFAVLSAGGAYQAVFNEPVPTTTVKNVSTIGSIYLFGETEVLLNMTPPSGVSVSSTTTAPGGSIELGAPAAGQTLYVGNNMSVGPYSNGTPQFTIRLDDLSQPNANGVSKASISIYYYGILTNTTSVAPGKTVKFDVQGSTLYVYVNQTFAGLYAYQKWAKIIAYEKTYTLQNGKQIGFKNGWTTDLLWTNTSGGTADSLYSIILYNQSPTNLAPGKQFNFPYLKDGLQNGYTFVGDTIGSANYDHVTATAEPTTTVNYQNLGSGPINVTEPASELVVQSQIPNAFLYAGHTSKSVTYDLTPYALTSTANANALGSNVVSYLNFSYTNVNAASWVSTTYPVTLLVTGYEQTSPGVFASISASATVTSPSQHIQLAADFYNVTGIQIQNSRALPGPLSIQIQDSSSGTIVTLATLRNEAPGILLPPSAGRAWDGLSLTAGNVIYNQQNGQLTTIFSLVPTTPTGSGAQEYFTYTMGEIASTTGTKTDQLEFGIYNSSSGVNAGTLFSVNHSASGVLNNMTYVSTQGTAVNAGVGFRTERGSKISAISSSSVTVDLAKQVDTLGFEWHTMTK